MNTRPMPRPAFPPQKTPDLRLSDGVQHGGNLVSHKVARVRRQRQAMQKRCSSPPMARAETREPPFWMPRSSSKR